jgi:hypothetical protein
MPPASFWTPGELLAWISGLVFMLSAFMGWYSTTIAGITFAVTGWNTGVIGKLVFVVGLLLLGLLTLRAAGFQLPPDVPVGLVIALLGAAGTILVLLRVIEIPDRLQPAGRSIGIWISLVAALGMIVAGLLKSGEETASLQPRERAG